jgi:hypothetical protein
MASIAGRRVAEPRSATARRALDVDTAAEVLLLPRLARAGIMRLALLPALFPVTDAGAALPVVLAELADVDAAKLVPLDLLFLLLSFSQSWDGDRRQAQRAGQTAAVEHSRDGTGHSIEAARIHGTSVDQNRGQMCTIVVEAAPVNARSAMSYRADGGRDGRLIA